MPPLTLEQAFDFSVEYATADEVARIRLSLEQRTIIVPEHAVIASDDDAITLSQVFSVIGSGVPVSKDFPNSRSRQAGINFEGRAGGSRKIRVKISWDNGYYVVTVHAIAKIKRKKSR